MKTYEELKQELIDQVKNGNVVCNYNADPFCVEDEQSISDLVEMIEEYGIITIEPSDDSDEYEISAAQLDVRQGHIMYGDPIYRTNKWNSGDNATFMVIRY